MGVTDGAPSQLSGGPSIAGFRITIVAGGGGG